LLYRLGASTEDFDSSSVLEYNKSVEVLNEPMDRMTLKSDHSGKSVSQQQQQQQKPFGSILNPNNNFQPVADNIFEYEAPDKFSNFQREPQFYFNNEMSELNQNLHTHLAEADGFLNLQQGSKLYENNINFFDPENI